MDNLHIPITGDNKNFLNALNGAREGVRSTARDIEQSGLSIEQMFNRIQRAAALSLAGFSTKEFIQKVVQVRGEFQQLEVAFTTMLGSAEKANALMQQLTKTAAVTPFDLQGVTQGAKQLLAYGIEAEKVNDTLVHLGDIAAGLSLPLNDLVYLYGTTMTQGRMFTQDLRQFMGRGIPIAEELAKQFGVTKDKVGELVTAGKVGAEEFNKAIMSMSSEGGKFAGLMEAQSKTITGQISNIEDAIDSMLNNIGQQSEGIINGSLSVVASLVENYEKVGEVILGVIATYGVYKAAVMTVTALQALQTAGVGALTAAETIHYGWLVLVQKAQALLNATMLANPYVLAATAVAGLAAALIFLNDSTNAEQAATESLNNTMDELAKTQEEYNKKTEEAITLAQNDAAATTDRDGAMQLLIARYPEIIKKYIDEEGHLSNILQLKKEIAAYDGQQQRAEKTEKIRQEGLDAWNKYNRLATLRSRQLSAKNVFSDSERAEIEALRKQYKSERGLSWYNSASLEEMRDYYKAKASQGRQRYARNLTENRITDFTTEGGGLERYNDAQLKALQKRLRDAQTNDKKNTSVFISDLNDYLTYADRESLLTRVEGMISARNQPRSTPSQRKAALKRELDDARKALEEFDKSSTKYTANEAEKERKRLLDAVDAAEKAYKAAGGTTSTRGGRSTTNKLKQEQAERERNQRAYEAKQREFAKQREQLETTLSQSYVDIEEDTKARELAQIKHDHEQEMAQFESQKQEYIRKKIELEEAKAKAEGKTYKSPANAEDVLSEDEAKQFANLMANIKAKQQKEIRDYQQAEADALNDYLVQYGTYQQQKLAIAKQYAERIRKASTEGEKMTLEKERDNKIAAVDANQMAMNIDWSQTFSGVGNVLSDIARETLREVKDYMNTDEFKKLSPEGKKAYTDLAAKLQQEGAGEATSPFNFKIWGTIAKNVEDYQNSVKALKAAEDEHTQAVERRKKAEEDLQKAVTEDAKIIAQANLEKAQADENETAEAQRKAEEKKNQSQQELKENTDKASKGLNDFTSALSEVSNGTLYGFANGITKLITSIGGASKGLSELGGKVGGIIGAILQIIDALGDDPAQFIEDLLDKIATVIEKVLEDLPRIITSVLEGVGNIVAGVVKGVAGIFGADLSGIFGGGTENFDAAVEKWGWLLDTWKDNLQYEKELMKEAYGTKVTDIQRKTEADLRQTQQAAASLYRGWASDGAGWFSHSNGYEANRDANWGYLWQYDQELAKRMGASEREFFGQKWVAGGDISNLFNLSAKELKELKHGNSQFWQSLSEEARKYLDQIIELEDEIEQLRKEAMEQLTATSFDTMVSDFQSALSNMDSSAEDFADNFEKYMQNAVLSALVAEKYKPLIEKWYKMFASVMEDGTITDAENEMLHNGGWFVNPTTGEREYSEGWDAITANGLRDRDALKNQFGWGNKEVYNQEASSGAWQNLGEETGQEINGRFTALQMSGEKLVEAANTLIETFNAIYGLSDSQNLTLTEIRNLMITNNAFLEDILEANKKYYEKFEKHLDKIEKSK
ncbi:MAG: tape measure protein [Prevotella sp.]|nr:tape measure protein [Prevotella sp.]